MTSFRSTRPSAEHQAGNERWAIAGFTLIGLLASITIIGILATITVPAFTCQIQKSKMASVMTDLNYGSDLIEAFEIEHGRFPHSLEEVYTREAPPETLIYCIDVPDANNGHGNEVCSFFDNGNPSGNNNHGGIPDLGYSLRTIENVAPCADFSLAWTYCCGREPRRVKPGDEADIPGHPGNPQGKG